RGRVMRKARFGSEVEEHALESSMRVDGGITVALARIVEFRIANGHTQDASDNHIVVVVCNRGNEAKRGKGVGAPQPPQVKRVAYHFLYNQVSAAQVGFGIVCEMDANGSASIDWLHDVALPRRERIAGFDRSRHRNSQPATSV